MRRRFDDDDTRDGPVRDGEKIRVPMMLMDSRMPAIDYGLGGPHRPGFRVSTDQAVQDARDKAYGAMIDRMSNAWKSPQRIEQDREAACDAARIEVVSMGDAQRARDEAYRSMVARMQNAWRNP